MSDEEQTRRVIDRPSAGRAARIDDIEVRRARRADVPAIAAVVRRSSQRKQMVDEAEVLDWLFGKGLLVAVEGEEVVGVASWQAENLLSVTDLFHVYPARTRAEAGKRLLESIEAEANVLMCEANVLALPAWTSKAVRTVLRKQGYEPKAYQDLHRIWREVLAEYVAAGPELMVKRLRDKMVMVPV